MITTTNNKIERAILDTIAEYNNGTNGIVPIGGLLLKLISSGFSEDAFYAALSRMAQSGLITLDGSPFLKLTEAVLYSNVISAMRRR